jgi:nucleotide-binding universal stress UspA family protein
MTEIRSIVVPTDFSPLAEAAALRAVEFARLDGAAIHLVHALGSPIVANAYEIAVPANVWEEIRRAASERIEETRKRIESKGVASVTALVAEAANPIQAIDDAVQARNADLVVMGTHGHGGLRHAFLGSVAERTLRSVARPIVAVKEEPARAEEPIRRILLAVDFSPDSDRAAELTADLAARLGASIDLLHAFDLPRDFIPYASDLTMEFERRVEAGVTERLEGVRERLQRGGAPVTTHLRRGLPSKVIAEVATEIGCQLIAMGTRGRNALAHVLLGSVAERTLRLAPCSVLIARSAEDERNA